MGIICFAIFLCFFTIVAGWRLQRTNMNVGPFVEHDWSKGAPPR